MNTSAPDLVNYRRPEVVAAQPDLDLIADLLGGTRTMQDHARDRGYIRKWADEDSKVYELRRKCETVFEGFGRILSAAVGMIHAKPPTLTWEAGEAVMADDLDNVDGQGTALPVFAKRFSHRAIPDGYAVILVDHPPAPEGVVITEENEQRLGLRPTWALYQRAQVCSWQTAVMNNVRTTTQLVLEEGGTERSGRYGIAPVLRYRVLRLTPTLQEDGSIRPVASWELWRATKEAGQDGFRLDASGVFANRKGEVADRLPIAVAYTGQTDAPFCADPPLMGVAWANLAHWQVATNLRFYADVASFPQPVVVGDLAPTPTPQGNVPGRVKLGPLVVVHLQGDGASFTYAGPTPEIFAPLVERVRAKLVDMAQQGMSFLVPETRAAETAEAKRLDAVAENATLATAQQGIVDALNLALEHHAWYRGIPREQAPTLTLSADFDATVMPSDVMTAYGNLARDIGLPLSVVLQALQQGGRIPADADLEELEQEMMANQAAIADQKAQQAADALAAAQAGKSMPPKNMGKDAAAA